MLDSSNTHPIYWTRVKTSFGHCFLASQNEKLIKATLPGTDLQDFLKHLKKNHTIIKRTKTKSLKLASQQLKEFYLRQRKNFSVPLNPHGTAFQKKVWNALRKIPYAKTVSYKDIAVKIHSPKASRAVGMANNKNPLPIFIPCHRVIGHNGQLVGFGGGLSLKQKLLSLEKFNK